MKKRMWSQVSMMLVSLMLLTACGGGAATEAPAATEARVLRIGILFTGPLSVGAWNISINSGLVEFEDQPNIELVKADNIDYANAAELMSQYGDEGFDLVIGSSSGFEGALREVAPDYPETFFVGYSDISSTDDLPNLAGYKFKYQDAGYLMGLTAALLTKSNKLGFVHANPTTATLDRTGAALQAVENVNPDITVLFGFTQSWIDLAKGKEIALAQIDDGADVIVNFAGPAGDGAIQAACERGVWVTGYVIDEHDLCPERVVVSWIIDHPRSIAAVVNDFISGDIEPGIHFLNMANNGLSMSPLYNVPDDVRQQVTEVYEQIKSGELFIDAPRYEP